MLYPQEFDVIVVGGGHAGTEAALAAARMGAKTLLLSHNIETLGQMSCNPSIGGIGKGHLVKEVDALGGAMALATDESGIQFRILNSSKGPAVRATRAQADRILYKAAIRRMLENQPNLWLFQQAVDDLMVEGDRVVGACTQAGIRFRSRTVVLTAGTFLDGKIHVGLNNYAGGRAGDPPAVSLSARLKELKLPQGRLKTGTPPRIDGRTIDFSQCIEQPGDGVANQTENGARSAGVLGEVPVFSFMGRASMHPQHMPCWITHTNQRTHDIIRSGFDRSPMFTGKIEGVGPRYCPSVEDKINRFADKDSHQIFLEPEGLTTHEYYPNGISTSLPFDIQYDLVRSMKGLENAHIIRPGYAIEYDYFDPRELKRSFETRAIGGLFFAGQINGTTGYEEAAGQGLIAGINAALNPRTRVPADSAAVIAGKLQHVRPSHGHNGRDVAFAGQAHRHFTVRVGPVTDDAIRTKVVRDASHGRLDRLPHEPAASNDGDNSICPTSRWPEQQRRQHHDPSVANDPLGDDVVSRYDGKHWNLGRGIFLAKSNRQRPVVRRRPPENDQEQHQWLPTERTSHGTPADDHWEAAGNATPNNVLGCTALQ